jgi:hypothetical protein
VLPLDAELVRLDVQATLEQIRAALAAQAP